MRNSFRSLRRTLGVTAATLALVSTAFSAHAETRVTYKSASAGTAYYQMGVELSEAIRQGTDDAIILTLEESQGSVQNVKTPAFKRFVACSPFPLSPCTLYWRVTKGWLICLPWKASTY